MTGRSPSRGERRRSSQRTAGGRGREASASREQKQEDPGPAAGFRDRLKENFANMMPGGKSREERKTRQAGTRQDTGPRAPQDPAASTRGRTRQREEAPREGEDARGRSASRAPPPPSRAQTQSQAPPPPSRQPTGGTTAGNGTTSTASPRHRDPSPRRARETSPQGRQPRAQTTNNNNNNHQDHTHDDPEDGNCPYCNRPLDRCPTCDQVDARKVPGLKEKQEHNHDIDDDTYCGKCKQMYLLCADCNQPLSDAFIVKKLAKFIKVPTKLQKHVD